MLPALALGVRARTCAPGSRGPRTMILAEDGRTTAGGEDLAGGLVGDGRRRGSGRRIQGDLGGEESMEG